MDWYLEALRKYAVFSGRSRRKEYWMFFLVNLLISFALGFIEGLAGIAAGLDYSLLAVLYSLFVLIPSFAVTVRRLHDTGRSGWWILIGLVPILGAIVLFVFMVLDSEPGTNRYGPSPKAQVAYAA